ncbi:hypothetical protein EJB05_56980, partial [Eragrostis curvula]
MRMLAYGTSVDTLDEYLKVAESTAMECMEKFAEGVIATFGKEYLRHPTCEEVEQLLHVGESRGFPGMLGSIDCMHWQWEKCPTARKGQYTRGDYRKPTVILEAVVSYDLRIWHGFFGMAGSNNDINVLNQSPLFYEVLKGEAPNVQFSVNGNEYNTGYYLADGIYPEWGAFVKTISSPLSEKQSCMQCIKKGQGKISSVLLGSSCLWSAKIIDSIMYACIIIHNIIVEDEGKKAEENIDLNHAQAHRSFFHLKRIWVFLQHLVSELVLILSHGDTASRCAPSYHPSQASNANRSVDGDGRHSASVESRAS